MSLPSAIAEIFLRAGFELHGRRAKYPDCMAEGHGSLCVSLTEGGLCFCHRCHSGGCIEQFARTQGRMFPPAPALWHMEAGSGFPRGVHGMCGVRP